MVWLVPCPTEVQVQQAVRMDLLMLVRLAVLAGLGRLAAHLLSLLPICLWAFLFPVSAEVVVLP